MDKILKYAVIIALCGFMTVSIVARSKGNLVGDKGDIENFPYINQMLLESSRYTQTDDVHPDIMKRYQEHFILSFSEEELNELGYERMFNTPKLAVYFEVNSFSMMVLNKETGYLWSSRPEFQGVSGTREDNTANRNLMNSGLWVEYIRNNNVSNSTITTASIYTLAGVSYENDGSITEEENDPLRPYRLSPGSYSKMRVENRITSKSSQHFDVDVHLKTIKTRFKVEFKLVSDVLTVSIPNDSIQEEDDIIRLLGIQIFPYFGASREDVMPGYIVIPDGVGALVRTNQRHNTSFQARFFGSDRGYGQVTIPQLSIPIYGLVHEVGQNGFMVEVEQGAETSQLRAQFWGTGTRYHRIGSRYTLRSIYRNVINKAGDGSDAILESMTQSSYQLNYHFLSHEEASYSGMATLYRDQLINRGVLKPQEKEKDQSIPIQLSYIMSDLESSFLGTSRVTMTHADDVYDSYRYFYEQGLKNQQITLYGWSRDGFMYRAPYRFNLPAARAFKNMVHHITEEGNTVYLAQDYVVSSDLSKRVNFNRDVARSINRLKISDPIRFLNARSMNMYYLLPEQSYRMAQADLDKLLNLNVSGLSMNDLGQVVFSYYEDGVHERTSSIETYQRIASLYPSLVMAQPNHYMFAYIQGYMDLPITNSQYDDYTDLIPLIPMILKGSISYYTPYLNFNALGKERLLTMVDFGINPSYVLTEKPTYEMRYTLANRFFTTTLANYQNEIVDHYHYINEALRHVIGAQMVHRQVIETGMVSVHYSNGVIIYVNYTDQIKTHGSHAIQPRDYKVVTS